jgi:hypothetical protein
MIKVIIFLKSPLTSTIGSFMPKPELMRRLKLLNKCYPVAGTLKTGALGSELQKFDQFYSFAELQYTSVTLYECGLMKLTVHLCNI